MAISRKLGRAIHNAVGMSDAEMEANPAEYIRRTVAMGMAILEQRKAFYQRKNEGAGRGA